MDGLTYVRGASIEAGDLVACEIIAADGYDLVARSEAAPPPTAAGASQAPEEAGDLVLDDSEQLRA